MLTEYHLCEIYVVFFFHADVGIFFVITVAQQSENFYFAGTSMVTKQKEGLALQIVSRQRR